MKKYNLLILIVLLGTVSTQANIYQWSVKLDGFVSDETRDNPDAFLWIPDNCMQVKAILVSQQNMCEETLFDHPRFRETMTDLDFAIIWIVPGIDHQWDVRNGCQEVFDKMLADLANVSGYQVIQPWPLFRGISPLGTRNERWPSFRIKGMPRAQTSRGMVEKTSSGGEPAISMEYPD